ncbi:MAG TPA: hypothetical protein VHE35_28315 [Kofleriaceae bacterium]|nr:hypothetical protein [Kofleriaceae bacterium]
MHHRVLCALAAVASVATVTTASIGDAAARPRPHGARKFEANKTFGLGLMVGAPSGLSGKYFYDPTKAIDFGIGVYRYYRHRDGIHLHVDHLWHPVSLAHTDAFELPLYFGIGARVLDFDGGGDAIGVRAPIGVAFDFNNVPLDAFFELALVLDFGVDTDDNVDGDLSAAIGARYWF